MTASLNHAKACTTDSTGQSSKAGAGWTQHRFGVAALLMALICFTFAPSTAFGAGATLSSTAAWSWPAVGEIITPYRNGSNRYAAGMHRGIDIAAPLGSVVRAATGGSVTFAGKLPDGALDVTLLSTDGRFLASHMHLANVLVKRGQHVMRGDVIGSVGQTGSPANAAPHLHFGVRLANDGSYVDPLSLLGPLPVAPRVTPAPQVAASVGQTELPSAQALEVPQAAGGKQPQARAHQQQRDKQQRASQQQHARRAPKQLRGLYQPVAAPKSQTPARATAPQLGRDGRLRPQSSRRGRSAVVTAAPGFGASAGTGTKHTRVKTRLELEPAQASSTPATRVRAIDQVNTKLVRRGSYTDPLHIALLLAAIALIALLVLRAHRDGGGHAGSIASRELLRNDADLLRQRTAAPRPRLLDNRR